MPGWCCGQGLWVMMVWILVLSVLVTGIVALVVRAPWRRPADSGSPPRPSGGALSVLEERYARGEISREELEERRRALGG